MLQQKVVAINFLQEVMQFCGLAQLSYTCVLHGDQDLIKTNMKLHVQHRKLPAEMLPQKVVAIHLLQEVIQFCGLAQLSYTCVLQGDQDLIITNMKLHYNSNNQDKQNRVICTSY